MKKYKKREMLDIVTTLIVANDNITNSNINSLDSSKIFERCQRIAILLGTYLESYGEKEVNLVKIIEEYCENIYQISLCTSDHVRFHKISKVIRKQLIQLKNGIEYDFPDDKKEVLFLPYKASMWDSMESVWLAASKDSRCETYVMPIPYFDKNPDGTLGDMHYEGEDYPDYVPITNWRGYKLQEHRPDIIYIHNPYDECNYVTSVHPDFYAKELKKYTDKLVYIPYFVVPLDKVEKHFCVMPGTLYADYVIVESENVRKTYIEELYKFEEANNCGETIESIQKKVLALGSPKYDKLLNTSKSELDIPDEWKHKICRINGEYKKVILYNTSISNLLKFKERMLKKIEDTLKVFKRRSKDVVILWRPHPLTSATIQTMCPELWTQYNKIVSTYVQEDWGIYDDSSDMDRAIILSDAYYGDGGSLFALYQATGKPMILQNVDITNKQQEVQ